MVIYYLTLVDLSPSSSWPLCKAFLKDNDADCLVRVLWDAENTLHKTSIMVSESLNLYSLHRKHYSPELIRDRAQGLHVDVDSPDSSGYWRGQSLGMFWGDFWTTVWTQSSSFQAADRVVQRVRWVEAHGFPWR